MAAIDRCAIEQRGIAGLYLMERAGRGIADFIFQNLKRNEIHRAAILCGKGNNGGDGLVIARYMHEWGAFPLVCLLAKGDELKGDALKNYQKARELNIPIYECRSEEELEEFFAIAQSSFLWIDALLGTGAKGAPRGLIEKAIELLNQRKRHSYILSVDISSGVEADTGAAAGVAVHADHVCTMGLPKVGQVLPPGFDFYDDLTVLDIGFPHDLIRSAECQAEILTASMINQWMPVRKRSAHKGTEGHLLVIAGSRGMSGAALMCSKAALHTGAGLITCVCPASLLDIYASSVWEMLTLPVEETENGSVSEAAFDSIFKDGRQYKAVVIGPGLGLNDSTQRFVQRVVREIDLPVLIDGDGITALSLEMLKERKAPWVITPHPGEMGRLNGVSASDVQNDRWGHVQQLCLHEQGVVALKGAFSTIGCKGNKLYVNPTGSSTMASGGMGDVLSGMIGTFLAKGLDPLKAASCGVFLHGLAADLLVRESYAEALSATQVLENIQNAVSEVRKNSSKDYENENLRFE